MNCNSVLLHFDLKEKLSYVLHHLVLLLFNLMVDKLHHSTFKLPIQINENSICAINKTSQ
jgi:hypothetical protein